MTITAASSPTLASKAGVMPICNRASPPNTALEDFQTQEQTMPADWTQPGLGNGKRKHPDDLIHGDARPLKKLKYSVAREPVELEG